LSRAGCRNCSRHNDSQYAHDPSLSLAGIVARFA